MRLRMVVVGVAFAASATLLLCAGLTGSGTVGDIGIDLLFVPVTLAAYFFGVRAASVCSVVAVSIAVALFVATDLLQLEIVLTSVLLLACVGGVVGVSSDRDRRNSRWLNRRHSLSLELLATTKNGRLVRVNPGWERQLGWHEDELIGRDFVEFVHPDDRERVRARREQLAHGEVVTAGPARMRHADGGFLWIEWSARHDADDDVNYIAGRDITEKRKAEEALALQKEMLERAVAERTSDLQARTAELDRSLRELELTRREEFRHLAMVAEFRDDKTAQHTERVGILSALIASELGLSESDIQIIRDAAPLHDIGKIGTPDAILLNTAELSDAERSVMRQHTYLGHQLLNESHSPVLRVGAEIAMHHHEWWDGSGYPAGIAGEQIPLTARVVALADVFDALTSHRPYKPAWSIDDARREIEGLAGRQFDPRVVAAFERIDLARLTDLAEALGSYNSYAFTG